MTFRELRDAISDLEEEDLDQDAVVSLTSSGQTAVVEALDTLALGGPELVV